MDTPIDLLDFSDTPENVRSALTRLAEALIDVTIEVQIQGGFEVADEPREDRQDVLSEHAAYLHALKSSLEL